LSKHCTAAGTTYATHPKNRLQVADAKGVQSGLIIATFQLGEFVLGYLRMSWVLALWFAGQVHGPPYFASLLAGK